jgi:uncharacterized DUF497 family protein
MENFKKHGIAFAEAVETFSDPDGFQLTDTNHSAIEERFFWVGKSESGKVLTTRFTRRGWRKFARFYNERTKTE